MKLFHTTTPSAARKIMHDGFKDGKGNYGLGIDMKGVFFSATVSNENDFAIKDEEASEVFIVDFPNKVLTIYQIINWFGRLSGKEMIREWCIPSKVVNTYFINRKSYSIDDPALYK